MRRYILFILIISLFGCQKSDDESANEPPTGDILGNVVLRDDLDNNLDDWSGMNVRLKENDNFFAVTDKDGDFEIENVPLGTYTLIYEKPGFGTFKYLRRRLQNERYIVSSQILGQISTTEIIGLDIEELEKSIKISVTADPPFSEEVERYFVFYLSTDQNVSSENYTVRTEVMSSEENPFVTVWDESYLQSRFNSGSKMYLKAYGFGIPTNSYPSEKLGRSIYPNLNPNSADAVSFIVP